MVAVSGDRFIVERVGIYVKWTNRIPIPNQAKILFLGNVRAVTVSFPNDLGGADGWAPQAGYLDYGLPYMNIAITRDFSPS